MRTTAGKSTGELVAGLGAQTGRTLLKWVPGEPIPVLIPLGVFIHDVADGRENTLIAFEGYTKLRGAASTREDKIRIQNNADTLEEAV